MGPAVGEHDRAAIAPFTRQLLVAGIAINLQRAGKAVEELGSEVAAATIAIKVDDAGRISPAPAALITRQRPEISRLCASPTGVEHRRPGLIHEQRLRLLETLCQPVDQRSQMEPSLANPASKRRAIQVNPGAGVDLGLAVQR